jgi:D-alanyl-D-alanine carboxypeptidase (penicillin-binding protein 5/6)
MTLHHSRLIRARLIRGPLIRYLCAATIAASCGMTAAQAAPSALETAAKEAIIVDYKTGEVLYDKSADLPVPPASITKLMTVYVVFDRLKKGQLKLTDEFPVSVAAWKKGGAASGGSTMFLKVNSTVDLDNLLKGIIIQSGNDACQVVAEGISGSEEAFAELMNAEAKKIGLTNSNFRDSSGLPDPNHWMTMHDIATLSAHIIRDFPEYWHYFADKEFTYNGIKQGNRNPLLYDTPGADGLKTGHIEASGYSVAGTVVRGNRRLIVVASGMKTMRERAAEVRKLVEWGFREFESVSVMAPGTEVDKAEVWLGTKPTVPLILEDDVSVTVPRGGARQAKVAVRYNGPLQAPIEKGQQVATLVVTVPDRAPIEVPLKAGESVERLGLGGRISAAAHHLLFGTAQ